MKSIQCRFQLWFSATVMLLWATTADCHANDTQTPSVDNTNTFVRNTAMELQQAVDERYSGVASASTAYEHALDNVIRIRANVQRAPDGTLKHEWVRSLGEAYDAVAAACKVCADNAEKIDAANWPAEYEDRVAKLKDKQAKDELDNKQAVTEDALLQAIPEPQRSIGDTSRLAACKVIIEQTQTRLAIYNKALSILGRIDSMVHENDHMISEYHTVYHNMEISYRQFAMTLYAVYDLQDLQELEKTVERIIEQPSLLRPEVDKVKTQWDGIRQDVRTIVGAS